MLADTEEKYQTLLTEILQKLIIILGPTIALTKARNVKGLIVTDDGTVTGVAGTHEETANKLIEQFSTLSESLVTQTMQPLLAYRQKLEPASSPTPPTPEPSQPQTNPSSTAAPPPIPQAATPPQAPPLAPAPSDAPLFAPNLGTASMPAPIESIQHKDKKEPN